MINQHVHLSVLFQAYALKAYEKNDEEFNIVKWVAALTGQCTNFMGTKEKIEQGEQLKMLRCLHL